MSRVEAETDAGDAGIDAFGRDMPMNELVGADAQAIHVHGAQVAHHVAVLPALPQRDADESIDQQSIAQVAQIEQVEVVIQEPVGALGGGGDGHGFSFQGALEHHNLAYPAIEWLHWKPILIFDLAKYTTKSADHWYDVGLELSDAEIAAYRDLAADEALLAKWQAKMSGKDGSDSEGFATALAGAGTSSFLGLSLAGSRGSINRPSSAPSPFWWSRLSWLFWGNVGQMN